MVRERQRKESSRGSGERVVCVWPRTPLLQLPAWKSMPDPFYGSGGRGMG